MVAGSHWRARGKSGLQRTGWSVTPTGRKVRESATENRPPRATVLVARGKGETVRQELTSSWGDPAGLANPTRSKVKQGAGGPLPDRRGRVRSADDTRVGRWRRRAIAALDKWPSVGSQEPPPTAGYRTRLTGLLRGPFPTVVAAPRLAGLSATGRPPAVFRPSIACRPAGCVSAP